MSVLKRLIPLDLKMSYNSTFNQVGGEGEGAEISCIICGVQFRHNDVAPVVKEEPFEGRGHEEGGNWVGDDDVDNLQIREGEREELISTANSNYWSEEENLLFQWFARWLKLELNGIRWNNSSKDPFPFCRPCKDQLSFLMNVRRRLEELEEAWKGGLKELKDKVNSSEEHVQLSGLYQRDYRYFQVRGQVTGSRFKSIAAKLDSSIPCPVIRLSEDDKIFAEQILHRDVHTTYPFDFRNLQTNDEFDLEGAAYNADAVDVHPPSTNSSGRGKSRGRPPKRNDRKRPVTKKRKADTDFPLPETDDRKHPDIPPKRSKDSAKSATNRKHARPKKEIDLEESVNVDDDNGDSIWMAEDDGGVSDTSDNPRRKRRPRKSKAEDEDFIPPQDPLDEGEESESEDDSTDDLDDEDFDSSRRHTSKGTKKMRLDSATGIITCLNVQFTPLENDLYSCSKCEMTVKRNLPYKANTFRQHVIQFHDNRFTCPECGYRATAPKKLEYHINTKHKGLKFGPLRVKICDICGRNLYSQTRLHAHRWNKHYTEQDRLEAISRGEEPPPPNKKETRVQCQDCGMLVTKSGIAHHMLRKHASEEEQAKLKVLCSICGRSIFQFQLSNHLHQSHPAQLGLPGHRCDECGKVFKLTSMLNRHKRTHRGLQFKCDICGKGFATDKSFQGHMNLHNNVRPYPCKHCPMAFASEAMHRKHTRHYHAEGSKPKRLPFLRGLSKSSRKEMESSLDLGESSSHAAGESA